MSSRVLKKLHGEKDLAAALGIDGMSESDDGDISLRGSVDKPVNNRFELLNSVEHSLSDTEAKEDDDRENEPPTEGQERNKLEKQDSTHSTDSLKRRKKKKKKKLKSQKSTEENLDDGDDEIEASIREVNKLLGEPEAHASFHRQSCDKLPHEKSVLSIDLRSLNPDNEMKKIFGSKVVQNEQVKKRGRGRGHGRSSILVSQKNWPHIGKPGLSMRLLETKGNLHYFAFEHSKQYQTIQLQFLEAVESFNPENIVALLNTYPYHIDALLQLSDICKMGDDSQMAAELIEKSIFIMECCFHPLFNLASGNCRLDYRITENRSFFIALFKHLVIIGLRGCNRTSLEFCKLLLSLDPDEDPLGVILMIDYYALRSSQYEYLIKLYYEWNPSRNLFQLPNFAFSVALATYLFSVEDDEPTHEADLMLQDALIMFPGFLLPMLNKCNVEPDKAVLSDPLFRPTNDPPALTQLLSLYVGRTYGIWKAPDIIAWLERQVREVMSRHKNEDLFFEECEEKKKLRFVGTPRNVLRHIILSDIRDATANLPQDLVSSSMYGFDPLPPLDSISSYARPTRPVVQDDRGVLSTFFRSLLPNFNVSEKN
ncbi:ribosome quality control complex subunit TCF25 isoform X2 [Parasteatoda tepidariorum]|uniref:ribosome quality control complex subunit TCF25 isoform X2 n=1 Tax=Parasteatoda tepidariorum TaxID=114398 RepID=UPI001C71F688|nr:transcription factor 25 isoform X2 [Parasteatoda tepidariorum]